MQRIERGQNTLACCQHDGDCQDDDDPLVDGTDQFHSIPLAIMSTRNTIIRMVDA